MPNIKYIAIKEIRHILRDPRSLTIAILMPLLMTFLYGYAINLDIKNIKLAVLDFEKSAPSRELIGRFYNSGYFIKPTSPVNLADPEKILKRGDANVILVIPSGLGKALITGSKYELGLTVDGADANLAAATSSYSAMVLQQFIMDQLPPEVQMPGVIISPQVLYNPDMKSSHFFVPGLIAIILMMISALLTSATIAREKETGTMEQLLTSPVTSRQIIVGKVIPYIGLALLDAILVLIFAVFHFGVPFIGSILLLLVFSVIYIIAALSIGILISALVKTQQLAMMTAMLVTVLPSVMLSGFIFEIKNMPALLQYITYLIPARYFLLIIRGIMLKGSGLGVLWVEALFLIILTNILLAIAVKKFNLKIG
ncbi:MAG: ABC transporter permease [candidate division Zixibacteria bacterium]|nr:ABC transporter permease [candidate division Zixibacteria bacterium]